MPDRTQLDAAWELSRYGGGAVHYFEVSRSIPLCGHGARGERPLTAPQDGRLCSACVRRLVRELVACATMQEPNAGGAS
jgi:hypothetical protein